MLSSSEVTHAKFTETKFRQGYDVTEVDQYLSLLSQTLKVHESGRSMLSSASELITPDSVLDHRFTVTKFRPGYDAVEVDDFLDEVLAALREHEVEHEENTARAATPGRTKADCPCPCTCE